MSTDDTASRPPNFPLSVGIEVVEAEHGRSLARLTVRPDHQAGNGYMHAGVVATIADTTCAAGCMNSLPEGALNFTTVELKINFVGSAQDGALRCEAKMKHGGRTTQVWEATVSDEATGKNLAFFTCTQMVLYPRS